MKVTFQTKNVDGRPMSGMFDAGGHLLWEVKNFASLEGEGASLTQVGSIDQSTRTVTGIGSVLGVLDSVKDRIHPGAFTKTIQERVQKAGRVRFLWNHDQFQPPVAVIKSVREIPRSEVPGEILAEFPDASGAVEVVRQYLDFPLADAVYKNILAKGLNEMSFGFLPIKFSYTKVNEDDPLWKAIREVNELKLMEFSDVHWGANPATMAVRSDDAAEDWKWFFENIGSVDLKGDFAQQFRAVYDHLKKAFEDGAEPPKPNEEPEDKSGNSVDVDAKAAEHSLQVARAKLNVILMEG